MVIRPRLLLLLRVVHLLLLGILHLLLLLRVMLLLLLLLLLSAHGRSPGPGPASAQDGVERQVVDVATVDGGAQGAVGHAAARCNFIFLHHFTSCPTC